MLCLMPLSFGQEDLSIYILDTGDGSHVTEKTGTFTRNIVYHEVFVPETVTG